MEEYLIILFTLLPTPYSRLPTPYSLLPIPYSLFPIPFIINNDSFNYYP
ncbi:MAG: hypothetical protein F6J90_37590 [Moorea sp. SIOASIH]|nr:hypothetical protein [Moorena sp. SIOASIH]